MMHNHKIIQYVRSAKQITQKMLSTELHITIPTISRIENGLASVENTLAVCNRFNLDFSKELFLLNELDFFVIPEPLHCPDLSLAMHLISKFECRIYIVSIKQNLQSKHDRSTWLFLIIEIGVSFYIFHGAKKYTEIASLIDFQHYCGFNQLNKSFTVFVALHAEKDIESIYDHTVTKLELKRLLKNNTLTKFTYINEG